MVVSGTSGLLHKKTSPSSYTCVKKKVESSVFREIMTQFTGPRKVTYPTVRSEIRTFNHANENQLFECHNPFHNQLPNRVIVALLEQTAFSGDNRKYAFSYKTFNITSIKQLVRGKEYPYTTLELDHNNVSKDFRGHHRFLQATESLCKRKGNMVRADDWGEHQDKWYRREYHVPPIPRLLIGC